MSGTRTRERGPVDWADVKRRLSGVALALEDEVHVAPDRAARILEARARELARPAAREFPDGPPVSLLAFVLGNETYAVEAQNVRGVFRLTDLAPLPGAGAHVAGVTLWRGELLVVLDLRQVLGLGDTGLDDRAWVVAIGDERGSRGLLAGTLRDLESVPARGLAAPRKDIRAAARYLLGTTPEATQVLDGKALLELEN